MKLNIFFLMYLVSAVTYAQISTAPLNCTSSDRGKPDFSLDFRSSYVTVLLKGNSYKVPFEDVYVDADGDRWTVYQDKLLRVATTLPSLNFSNIQVPSGSKKQVVTSGKCF